MLIFIGASAAALLVLLAGASIFGRADIPQSKMAQLTAEAKAKSVAQSFAQQRGTVSLEQMRGIISAAGPHEWLLVDRDGQTLLASRDGLTTANFLSPADLKREQALTDTRLIGGGAVRVEPLGNLTLLLREPLQPLQRGRGQFMVLLISGAFLIIAALAAASYVTRPLRALSHAAERLAAGDRDTRVEIRHNDEVGELARTFNAMAETIQAREAELVQASAAKTRFLATVTHELRTPLTAILGYCDMLKDGLRGPQEAAERIQENATTLLAHINDLLDVSRIEAGRLDLRLEPIQIAECLEAAYAAVAPQLERKGLKFTADIPETPIVVPGDFQRLQQVFTNLLANAVKFTEQGEIKVSARATRDQAEITVTDTGSGIPEAMQELIFEPFRQVNETAARSHGGTGLGLAISRRLLRLHNGEIRVASTPGQGSTFTVSLPVE